MRVRIVQYCLLLFCLFFCSACGKKDAQPVQAVQSLSSNDTIPKIALTRTLDCLPFYWAQRHGIYSRLKLDVEIETYSALFDCDTAVLNKAAVGGISDLVRLHYYRIKGKKLEILTATNNRWGLAASHDMRIKSLKQLKNHMVAVARYSASELYCKLTLEKNGLSYTDVFRPQINDYELRTTMLNENQVNAAVLPEPYLTWAAVSRHEVLAKNLEDNLPLCCFLINPEASHSLKDKDFTKKLLQGYNEAVDSINKGGKTVCLDVLFHDYKLPAEVIDSLQLVRYDHARQPDSHSIETAKRFVTRH